jgi:tetratricopeptide (TPR) repeat protein
MSSKTNDTDNLTIGTVVRCEQPNGTMRTATVAYINKNSTVDLIYSSSAVADGLSNSTTNNDEEDSVPMHRVHSLHDFEDATHSGSSNTSTGNTKTSTGTVRRAERMKDEASMLFKLKDYEAAYEKYQEALQALSPTQTNTTTNTNTPCVGSTVLVREKGKKEFAFHFVPALVSIVDEQTVDVMYHANRKKDRKKDVEEEEDGVSFERIHVLPPQTLGLTAPLQCTLHLNSAVCNLKLKRFSLAIEHASVAVAIAKFSHSKESTTGLANKTGDNATAGVEVWVKGFWIRGKAQVALNHFKEAKADAKRILLLSGQEENKQAFSLLALIEKKQLIAHKKDVKLVKKMSEYIGVAMDQGGGKTADRETAGGKYSHK